MREYDDGFVFLAPVGSFQPNPYGLYDMTGNVWEWVQDFYHLYSKERKEDPAGPKKGEKKVLKGGGFDWEMSYLRVQKRRSLPPSSSAINLGFRVVASKAKKSE